MTRNVHLSHGIALFLTVFAGVLTSNLINDFIFADEETGFTSLAVSSFHLARLIEFLFVSKTQSSDIPFVTLYNLITIFDIEAQQLRNPSRDLSVY